jgi:hypothetical protein
MIDSGSYVDEPSSLNRRLWQTNTSDDFSLWEQSGSDLNTHPLLSSATDLLIAWMPQTEEVTGSSDPQTRWDRYFQSVAAKPPVKVPELAGPAGDLSFEPWNIDAAESAVDCLFTFLRALETCNVTAAMRCVSKHYHVVEEDREIVKESLQVDLEKQMDQWRTMNVQITTTEVPDPIRHPAGILIPITIQVDITNSHREQITSQLISRLCVFSETETGEWLLTAMARIR